MTILELRRALQSEFVDFEWSLPPDLKLGILTTNQAFKESAKAKQAIKLGLESDYPNPNPVTIAEILAQRIRRFADDQNLPILVVTFGAYINIDLQPLAWPVVVSERLSSGPKAILPLEQTQGNATARVMLEYVSPNVAKPLHAGHVRNVNLGECLRRILRLRYPDLITDNYWGDWGVQFGILLWGYKQFRKHLKLQLVVNEQAEEINYADMDQDPIETLVRVYIWSNQQKDQVPDWEELVRQEFILLEQGDKENRSLWEKFLQASKLNLSRELQELKVTPHDYEYGESYYEPDMRRLQQFLEEQNIWQKEGLARYFDFEFLVRTWPDLPSEMAAKISRLGRVYLISSNGYSSYAFRDIATRWAWARDFQTDKMITVTGNEQRHHFEQFFAVCAYLSDLPAFRAFAGEEVAKRMGFENLVHVSYGFLTLPEGKMSTRKGNILRASDLLLEIFESAEQTLLTKGADTEGLLPKAKKVGIAALKWFDLNRDGVHDVVLDKGQILSFEGNTGVYQLYTIVRLQSILHKNSDLGVYPFGLQHWDKLNEDEQMIIKTAYHLPWVLEMVSQTYKPHILCQHLYQLATLINSWYAKYQVSTETDVLRKQAMLEMCGLAKAHLCFALELLGIEPVESL